MATAVWGATPPDLRAMGAYDGGRVARLDATPVEGATAVALDLDITPAQALAWVIEPTASKGLGPRVSAPVIAAGMVFAADVDGHAVCAMNAADGKIVWRFSTEGRVDSPPTYHQGLLLFGSRDGSAYCLRAADGALAWRFVPLEH